MTTYKSILSIESFRSRHVTDEPFVPSKAIIVRWLGMFHCLYYHGSALTHWIENNDFVKNASDGIEEDGIYVWSGTVNGSTDYWGEYDEWLEGETRPITAEEWKSFIKDELIWDKDALIALDTYHQAQDKAWNEELQVLCKCMINGCEVHHADETKRKEILQRLGMNNDT